MPRRQRQRGRQKSSRLNRQNNNPARASRFFVHFFAVTARLRGEIPNFTLYGGRKQATAMNMVLRYSAQKEFACV